ncbi:hypothetical protein SCP_0905360 [Sparassis crispa]|uniref:Uncharacterized protein n=1 Tax=Sparassis crispa TaxID=139825 RepID=A0A401GWQ1_9APHY|nr:hypothetical protein SCP_0905360 [Sparassis crispa]GBE86656.1 hypothetical protein SCP_0905360 [Sparassis crispa]
MPDLKFTLRQICDLFQNASKNTALPTLPFAPLPTPFPLLWLLHNCNISLSARPSRSHQPIITRSPRTLREYPTAFSLFSTLFPIVSPRHHILPLPAAPPSTLSRVVSAFLPPVPSPSRRATSLQFNLTGIIFHPLSPIYPLQSSSRRPTTNS